MKHINKLKTFTATVFLLLACSVIFGVYINLPGVIVPAWAAPLVFDPKQLPAATTSAQGAIVLGGALNGFGTASTAPTITDSGVTAATYGDATHVSQLTIARDGRTTLAANVLITGTAPGGAAGGDLTGTYPNPTVIRINGALLGTTTATSGNLLVGDGTDWDTVAMSGDATFASTGALTLASTITAGGPAGSATTVPVITYDAKGRLTTVSSATIALPASAITSGQLALARGGTNADLSATGGSGQYLKQASSGAAVTVGAIASGDLPLNTISQAGAVTTAPNDATKFWRGDATWASDAGVGGSALIFALTTPVTLANSAAETSIATTGTGSLTIGAGAVSAGQVYRVRAHGVYSTKLATTPTLAFNLYLGSTQIATTGAITQLGNLTNQGYTIDIIFTVINAGASGSVECQGWVNYETAGTTALTVALTNTAVVGSIDFTASKLIALKAQWNATDPADTLTNREAVVITDLTEGTVTATTVAGGVNGRTLRDNGTTAVWNSALTNDGTDLTMSGAFRPTATNTIGLTAKGLGSQTGDLFQFQSSAAVVLGGVTASGYLYLGSTVPAAASEALLIDTNTTTALTAANPAIVVSDNNNNAKALFRSAAALTQPELQLQRGLGTIASPTAITGSNNIGRISAGGYDGAAWVARTGSIDFLTSQNWNSATIARGTDITFSTVNGSDATATLGERVRIMNTGRVGIGTTAPATTLAVVGGLATGTQSVAAASSTTLTGASSVVFAAGGTTTTLTLPAASLQAGQRITVFRKDATGTVNITRAGSDTIVSAVSGTGQTTIAVPATAGKSITLIADGTSIWYVEANL